jgi:hypothetical protein
MSFDEEKAHWRPEPPTSNAAIVSRFEMDMT